MAMCVKDVREWLDTLPDDEVVFIDDGGLVLLAENTPAYLELGGEREQDDSE